MKVRLVLSIAVACCVACPWRWLTAEEEIKYPSPDGRFALRITQSKEDEYHPTVELIEKDSGKVMFMLHDGSDTDLFDPSACVLVWSADSKRVAYGFQQVRRASGYSRSERLSVFGTAPVLTKHFCLRTCRTRKSNFPREKKGT